jgi:hypothetical protein
MAVMHENSREKILNFLRHARTVTAINTWLDYYFDNQYRATEWDAAQWGFGDAWMAAEREQLRKRGGPSWPREVI